MRDHGVPHLRVFGGSVRTLDPDGLEVKDIGQAIADLRARGLNFETFDMGDLEVTDQIVVVPNNYPSKGTGERGAFFFDSEGNLLAIGQATP